MDSYENCGKSSATKKLKGFTLIEMLIVIAIIAILAGMISIATNGLVRDARLESARTSAQEVYTGIQNALIQIEIKQQDELLDPTNSKYGGSGTFSKYVTLSFIMEKGNMSSANGMVIDDGTNSVTLSYDYPNASAAADDKEKAFRKLAKYLTDNLAMDFTGYVYAAIDMEDWLVDSVVFVEDYAKVNNATNGIADFIPKYKTKTSGSTNIATVSNGRIPFCDDIYQQKKIYSGKDTAALKAVGTAVGYYPFYNDIKSSTTVTYN